MIYLNGRRNSGNAIALAIAVWLGIFLEDYEGKNSCPDNCKIDHKHIIYDTEQNIDKSDKETSEKATSSK